MATNWQRYLLGLLIVGAVTGCGDDCTDIEQEDPGVLVLDATDDTPICDATLSAAKGGLDVEVSPGAGCDGTYRMAYAGAGAYTVTVQAQGFVEQTVVVQITADECGHYSVANDGPQASHPGFANLVTVALVAN